MDERKLVIAEEADGTFTVVEVSRICISNHATIKEAREASDRIMKNDEGRVRP